MTASMAWPRFHSEEQNHRAPNSWQHRLRRETPNMHRAKRIAPRECGWKHGDSGYSAGETNFVQRKNETTHLTPTGLLMEGHIASVRFSFGFFGVNERYGDVTTASRETASFGNVEAPHIC